mmetsp:Transcript_7733/g.9812  ORF Transcript_7733/g.9812 Transcript_7733/m.9812 type:complete len:152 (+) Transcript_7733:307-762(+)
MAPIKGNGLENDVFFQKLGSSPVHPLDRHPSGLSRSDAEALVELRVALWRGGAIGFAAGFITGKVGYSVVNRLYPHLMLRQRHFNVAAPLGVAAVGALVFSIAAGRNEIHSLHYVLTKGSKPKLTEYQQMVEDAKKTEPGLSWEELRERQR